MKAIYLGLALIVAVLAIGLVLGCQDDKKIINCADCERNVITINVYVAHDTIAFLPGDTASDTGFVLVKDYTGSIITGIQVDLSLVPSEMGRLELADSLRRDTTDENGRIGFHVFYSGREGPAVINAQIGEAAGFFLVFVNAADHPINRINIRLYPGVLHFWDCDSVLVMVSYTDLEGLGIQNVPVPIDISRGRIQPFGFTDSSGSARAYWWPNCCGTEKIMTWYQGDTCSAFLLVQS